MLIQFPNQKEFPQTLIVRAAFSPQSALIHSGLRMNTLSRALAPESLTDWGAAAWISLTDEHTWLAPLFRAAEARDDDAVRAWVETHSAECAPLSLETLTAQLTEALGQGAGIDHEGLVESLQQAWEAAVSTYMLQVDEHRDDAELERIAASVVALEETAEGYHRAGHDELARGLRTLIQQRWGLDARTVATLTKALHHEEGAA
ncbi:Uncharacterised protein [Mycobacteroides abscessus subsp. abscessus]|uniref:Uncharacterized protein n=1 Tax=Mycobacteroides abscessus subsp. bolletii TaxID=319705 RepID=A0A9Q7WK81_9MYCO|nr:hypothetical protein [Mycobacteroides abscessus]SHT47414.1 Uncharacterised protein [Mycobacteroides abscessus subsp. abscessus]SHT56203.1 Uncharacterised protein [Mycobacteroides abscessus subsp. abscessus]SHU55715.1 Uncharacterised protein [Mycobacteroides abscessus subsp. bolletii]SHU73837.1 Uncharacterised protein [Mycobacteroides abscessus subsp. bolletii]SHX83311.1 Uncharacterised protein [Mycobacteroides abscessus subsp. bolletii]